MNHLKTGKLSLFIAVAFLLCLQPVSSFAREGGSRTGFGVLSWGGVSNGSSVGVQLDVSSSLALGIDFAMTSITPSFNFGGTVVLKGTVAGDQNSGLHLGLGANMGITGTPSVFNLNALALVGVHYGLGSNILLAFDSGVNVAITPSPVNLTLNTYSALLGASVHYFF